jgi:hypothetical protein
MIKKLGVISVTVLGLASGALVTGAIVDASPVQAQNCSALRAVESQSTQIDKKVSAPGAIVSRSNWNTDFVVPSEQVFSRFFVTVLPKNGGEYKVQMALKYNNNTSDQVYNQTVKLPERKPFTISGVKRANATPYQVNVSVGGLAATGNSYTVSVCGV